MTQKEVKRKKKTKPLKTTVNTKEEIKIELDEKVIPINSVEMNLLQNR